MEECNICGGCGYVVLCYYCQESLPHSNCDDTCTYACECMKIGLKMKKGDRVRINDKCPQSKLDIVHLSIGDMGEILMPGRILLVKWDKGFRGTINHDQVDLCALE